MRRRHLYIVLVLTALASSFLACNRRASKDVLKLPKETPLNKILYDPVYARAAEMAEAHLLQACEDLGVPALSAAVSVRGETVWAGAVGWADVAKGIPATPITKFRIGNTSEALTATALARLVDEGLLKLDVPIGATINDLPNPKWIRMTPRQLASHTAGFPAVSENSDRGGALQTAALMREYSNVTEALDVFDEAGLLYAPGQAFRPTPFGFNLLAVIMQEAAEQPFLDLMNQRVFTPLGMRSTNADHQNKHDLARAVFYGRVRGGVLPWRPVNLSLGWPSGGFLSTPSDLTKLGAAWFDPAFIKPETRATMWTPQKLAGGEENSQGYALGWHSDATTRIVTQGRPLRRIHRSGISEGAMSWLVIYPELEMAVALSSNARSDTFIEFVQKEYAITRAFMEVAQRR